MARPTKTFTPDEAAHLIRTLWLKSRSSDWYDFEKNLRVAPDLIGEAKREQLTKTSAAAMQALDVLMNSRDRDVTQVVVPAALRAWIDTYLSDEGWKRIQAARRQRKSSIAKRDLLTKMSKESSWGFAYLAEAAGMTKKDYLSQLSHWMIHHDAGRRVAAAFAASLKSKA